MMKMTKWILMKVINTLHLLCPYLTYTYKLFLVCLYEEIMRLMSTIDNKGNYKPFKSNVAAMACLLAHSPRPMVSSTLLRWHHILYYSHIQQGQINLEFVFYTLASFCAICVIVYEVLSSRVCQSNYSKHLESTNIKLT